MRCDPARITIRRSDRKTNNYYYLTEHDLRRSGRRECRHSGAPDGYLTCDPFQNRRLHSGKKPDAVTREIRHKKELKPNNPRAAKGGEKQVGEHVDEQDSIDKTGKPWTGSVEFYD
jgi:hypothetical protein